MRYHLLAVIFGQTDRQTDRKRERGTVLSRGAQWSFFFFLELSSVVSIASDVDIICT